MNATSLRGALLAAFACILVGASFTANSVLGDYPYAGGQALRYGLAALLLLPVLRRGGGPGLTPLRTLTGGQWGRLGALAAIGMLGFNLAVLAAERSAEPAVPGVFVGCAPIVVSVVLPVMEGRRPSRAVLYAACLVAAGAFTVQGWGRTDPAGILFSVGALAGEVGFAVLAVPVLRPLGPALLSATVCVIAAVESALLGLMADGAGFLPAPTTEEALALLWQAAVVTVVGFVCWYSGMRRIGAERATLFSGLIPVSAALTAPLVGAGTYGVGQGAGSLMVGAGVALGSGVLGRRAGGAAGRVPRRKGRNAAVLGSVPGERERCAAGRGASATGVENDPRHRRGVVVHGDVAAAGQTHEPGVPDDAPGPQALPAREQAVLAAPGDGDGNTRHIVGEGGPSTGRQGLVEAGGSAQSNGFRHDGLR
ncbi:drug/metabolite transporter (DMT)-like permease [Streptomyces sp. B1I3]|nr:drug/metabolite transporter (DMT)-like permease [Streptomyces sp. B1I3]